MTSRPLELHNLQIRFGPKSVLEDVTLHVAPAEIVGLLGASGSGKTSLAHAILGILFPSATIGGSIEYASRAAISWIAQEPSLALHPLLTARDHVVEVLRAHLLNANPDDALRSAGLTDPRHWRAYPHQLSGGERQRVLIAQAIATRPALLIADEPTASLDPTLQAELLDLFQDLRQRLGMAVLFITHNPMILRGFADRVLVLYNGRIVEEGTPDAILDHPVHPWTRSLASALEFTSIVE